MTPEYMSRVINDVAGPDATIVNELGLATEVLELEHWTPSTGPPSRLGSVGGYRRRSA